MPHVLIVADDCAIVRTLVSRIMKPRLTSEWVLVICENGTDVINTIRETTTKNAQDVRISLFTDNSMPGAFGIDILRQYGPHLHRAVLCSGDENIEIADIPVKNEDKKFYPKPCSFENVSEAFTFLTS